MKIRNTVYGFVAGMVLGVFLSLTSGVFGQNTTTPKKDWSHVSVVTYPSGATGFFDQSTGRLYIYDANWQYCFAIREVTTLGEPLRALR